MSEGPVLVGGGSLDEIPYLRRLDAAALFRRRAERLGALADGHAAGDYLALLGRIAAAQASALAKLAVSPNGRDLPRARPLDAARARPAEWREALSLIARELEGQPMPEQARAGLGRAARLGPEEREALAARLLSGGLQGLDLAAAPFAAAALQVPYAALAAQIPPEAVARAEEPGCPLCGSPPVAALVLGDDKLRYLACSLCGSQWYLTRIKCSHCQTTAGISYLEREGPPDGVKAETCEACKAYLKLFYLEQRPAAEPLADDAATLALDLAMAERGFARIGVNLFLLPGTEGS